MKNRNLIIFFTLMSAMSIVVALTVELTDNEAYYWSWSLRPDLSYFDHPPLLSWTLWITTQIFGKTNLAIRLPAILSFWACNYLFMRWMRKFDIPWQNAIALCISSPLFFVFSWITLPDILFLPLSLLTIDCLLRRHFLRTGICLGLAILAKWHGFILIPGIMMAVFLMNINLTKKINALILAFGVAAVLQLPVFIWNYQHNWVAFKYHLINRHSSGWKSIPAVFLNGTGFILGLVTFFGGAFVYLLIKFIQNRKSRKTFDRDDLVLLAFSLPFMTVFGLAALKGETRIYWSGFAFFPLSIFLIREMSVEVQGRLQKIGMASCFLMMNLLIVVLYFPVGSYVRPIVENFRSYDIRFSPRGDVLGWKEWASQELTGEQVPLKKLLFVASDIRLASQLLWNSDIDFNQVTVIHPIKQYTIWETPKLNQFSKVVLFGDNRRRLNSLKINPFCTDAPVTKKHFQIHLLNEVVKVIEVMKCMIPSQELTDTK